MDFFVCGYNILQQVDVKCKRKAQTCILKKLNGQNKYDLVTVVDDLSIID